MVIYRPTDRIPIRIDGVTVWIAPLSRHEKMKLLAYQTLESGERVMDQQQVMANAVKLSVKKIEGVSHPDGSVYEALIGPDGYLTDDGLEDLLNLFATKRLAEACTALASEIKDHEVPGVVIDVQAVVTTKKADCSASSSSISCQKSNESAA